MSVNGVDLVQIDLGPKYVSIEMPQDDEGGFIDMGREGADWELIECELRNTAAVGGNYAELGVGNSGTYGKEYRCGGPSGSGGAGPDGCNKFRPGKSIAESECTFVQGPIHGLHGSCRFEELTKLGDHELDLQATKFTKEDAGYGERPNGIAWGCSNCQTWGIPAKSPDSTGRNIFCRKWGCRVRQKDAEGWQGCCEFNRSPGDIAFKGNSPYTVDGDPDDDSGNDTDNDGDGAAARASGGQMKYSHVVKAFFSSNWAILPEKYEAIRAVIELRASGGHVSQQEIEAMRAASRPSPKTAGNVAVIPIYGTICYRASMFSDFSGGTSVQGLTKMFRQALADESIKAIVFDVDSPGGEVDGIQEFADEIFNARGQKKIVAVANTLSASAAYWIASSAEEMVVTPSGQVGSIGVFTVHTDLSQMNAAIGVSPTYVFAGKYKTEGNPDQPLSSDAQAAIQSTVDSYYNAFVNAVARNRGVSASDVRNGFGEGRVVVANDAKKLKMVDRIATFDQTLARFGASGQVRSMDSLVEEAAITASSEKSAMDDCECECAACEMDNHAECSNEDCRDPYCKEEGCPMQSKAKSKAVPIGIRQRQLKMAERRVTP